MIPAGYVRAFLPALRALLGDQLVVLVLARSELRPSGVEHIELHSERIRVVELLELLEDDGGEEDLRVTIPGPPGITYTLSLTMGEAAQ